MNKHFYIQTTENANICFPTILTCLLIQQNNYDYIKGRTSGSNNWLNKNNLFCKWSQDRPIHNKKHLQNGIAC